jgi:hypothetical protein
MKVAATALLLGAASAVTFQKSSQEVLSAGDAKAIWGNDEELSLPKSFDQTSWFPKPKPHDRKPDSAWDYVVDGAALQAMWTRDASGGSRRAVDGTFESYNLRGKKVDPSKLGVDKVKQYSGYLDDEANDKHLFYCKPSGTSVFLLRVALEFDTVAKGSSSLETIPRTTRLSCGSTVVLDVRRSWACSSSLAPR